MYPRLGSTTIPMIISPLGWKPSPVMDCDPVPTRELKLPTLQEADI